MAVAWPSAVNTVQYMPITKAPLDQRAAFQTDAGIPKLASRSTEAIYAVTFGVQHDQNENDAFWAWWEGTGARGSVAFTGFQAPFTTTSATYIFRPGAVPQFQRMPTAATRYQAVFDLYQLP